MPFTCICNGLHGTGRALKAVHELEVADNTPIAECLQYQAQRSILISIVLPASHWNLAKFETLIFFAKFKEKSKEFSKEVNCMV